MRGIKMSFNPSEKCKIALMGGSGFIGTRLSKRLLDSGHDVKILDKVESRTYPHLWIKADVRDKATLLAMRGCDVIYNLAAEHRDDVTPRSLYYDVNVKGAENICNVAEEFGIRNMVFTSTVAVYGFTDKETDESGELRPFNDYGRSKLEAEKVYQAWQRAAEDRSLVIIRPTVVFGENNRGNVYNLLRQIKSGLFLMIGNGKNVKSIVYVENIAAMLEYSLQLGPGYRLFNAVDKPDCDMNTFVALVNKELGRVNGGAFRVPYPIGYAGGLFFDMLARLTGKKLQISSIRIKKFCSNTQFASSHIKETDFVPPCTFEEGLKRTIQHEFFSTHGKDEAVFYTE